MRLFRVLSALLFLPLASAILAADPPSDKTAEFFAAFQKAPPGVAPAPRANPVPGGPWLGRAKPQKQYDYGHFRAVVGSDGKTRYFPRLTKHIDTAMRAAPIPASVNWGLKAPNVLKTMLGNDQQGDCVLASRGHRTGIALANDTGKETLQTATEALKNYHEFCGGGDNGCDMSAVNQLEQSRGILYNGVRHKTDGAVSIDHTNVDLIKTALIVFGNLEIGMSLPNAWYQSADGSDWGVTNSAIVGGHEVQGFGFDDKGVWISTWGGVRRILWAAFTSTRWIDEVYTSLAPDWYGADNLGPNGISTATLKADLAAIANGQIPPLPDPGPTPPDPKPPVPPDPKPPAPPGALGAVTVDPVSGIITAIGPWKLKGTSAVPSVAAELLEAGVSQEVIDAVLTLIAATRKQAKPSPGPGGWRVPRRGVDREYTMAG